MKIPILILLTTILLIHYGECRSQSWFPNIFDTFANKTAQISNYMRTRGRSIKNYYHENVRQKLSAYLSLRPRKTNLMNITDAVIEESKRNRDYDEEESETSTIPRSSPPPFIPKSSAHPTQRTTHKKCAGKDPRITMTTPQLIAYYGYPSESHTIVTEDNYILTVHRIPYAKKGQIRNNRKTVLLHHGLLGSSADWVITGSKKSLAFILSEAGYDVWLANVRGNTYSRAHKIYDVDSHMFWNFTFHEVSQYDLPAVIDYIMDLKGWDSKINYIGHSMGTTALFAMLSTKTKYNKILRAGYALAPVAYMTEIKSPLRLLAKFSHNIEYLMKLLGADEFLPQNSVMRWLAKHACEVNYYEELICENSMFIICGFDEAQFDKSLLPQLLGHVPAGASTKTLAHYAQEISAGGKFQQFDYGPEINYQIYKSFEPPEYPIQKITLPIALFSAENDWLASDVDVTNLYVQLDNPIEHYIVPFKEFNHIDFLWGIDAPNLVYLRLLQLLEEGVNHFEPSVEAVSKVVDVKNDMATLL